MSMQTPLTPAVFLLVSTIPAFYGGRCGVDWPSRCASDPCNPPVADETPGACGWCTEGWDEQCRVCAGACSAAACWKDCDGPPTASSAASEEPIRHVLIANGINSGDKMQTVLAEQDTFTQVVCRTLVVAVVSDALDVRSRILNNLWAQPDLDFGVVLYKGSVDAWAPEAAKASIARRTLRVRQGAVPPGVDQHDHGFIPKLWLWAQASDWVVQYDYVWFVDEDMSFVDFNYAEFWELHQSVFPTGPPLIAQPTIRESTQWLKIFNHDSWLTDIRAATSTSLEQQAPLFDARVWLWFVPQTAELRNKQVELANDWVTDLAWCAKAKEYNNSRTACAILNVPLSHLNTNSIGYNETAIKHAQFVRRGMQPQLAPRHRGWL